MNFEDFINNCKTEMRSGAVTPIPRIDTPYVGSVKQTVENLKIESAEFKPKNPVLLTGAFFFVHLPTEARMKVQVGPLNPEQLQEIWKEVEDWRRPVDERYKIKTSRGRASEARGSKIVTGTIETRERIFSFPVFPSSYLNVLSTVRRELCEERIRNCLVLEEEQIGNLKQNLYILPYGNLPDMLKFITKLNDDIAALNNDVAAFLGSKDFANLKSILRMYNSENIVSNRDWNIPRISWRVTPIALDPTTVMQMVEAEKGKMTSEVLEIYRKDLEQQQNELVKKAIEKVQNRVTNIVERIVSSRLRNPERVKEDLEKLKGLATSIGLTGLSQAVINPLIEVVDDPSKMQMLFGTKVTGELPAEISGRVRGLIARL